MKPRVCRASGPQRRDLERGAVPGDEEEPVDLQAAAVGCDVALQLLT
jgi:hypothetical protein